MDEQQEEIHAPIAVEEQETVSSTASLSSLIIDLHKVLDEARSIIVKYQQRSGSLDEREKNVFKRELSVGEKEKSLSSREADVSKVEDIVQKEKDAQALLDRANLAINESVEQRKALDTYKQEQMSLIAQDRLLAQQETSNALKRKNDIENEVNAKVDEFLVEHGFKQPSGAVNVNK